MSNKASPPTQSKTAAKDNQGEGDKRSAKRFNSNQKEFVQSARGQDAIEQAGDVAPEDESTLAQAEREGASRAKGEDPAVSRHHAAAVPSNTRGSTKSN